MAERVLAQRYRIIRSLGRGGLGSVYLCEDLRLAGKQWALKQMLRPEPELRERFRETFDREARTLSRLRHPNMPVVVDYFDEGDDCYLVMEFVEGENLAEYVRRRGPLSEEKAFDYGLELAELLHFLHTQEPPIIFRDLKPENIMVTPVGRLKLVDFGLARVFTPGKHRDTVPSGSVGYAAPEQWEDLFQTDARSDIYSWGATLLHLLSGKNPSPVFPVGVLETIDPLPSARGIAILGKCLKPRAEDRFSNASALAAAVRTHLAALRGEPMPPPSMAAPAVLERVDENAARQLSEAGRNAALRGDTRWRDEVPTPPPLAAPASPAVPRDAWRWPPLALLVLATLAFFYVLWPRPAVPPPALPVPQSTLSGLPPYRLQYESNQKKDEGKLLYEEGRFTDAIAALDQACTEHPDDAEAQILKQDAYVRVTGARLLALPFIGSLSGADAAEAFAQLHGLALAQQQCNASNGIEGRKIVLELHDDESSTSRCLGLAEQICRHTEAPVVIGAYNSQRTSAIAPIFNSAGIPLVSAVASSKDILEAGPCIFNAADSSERRVRALAAYIQHQGARRVALAVNRDSRLSMEMGQTFKEAVAPNVTVSMLPPYQDDQLDFSAQVDAVRQLKPEAIFVCDFQSAMLARFAAALRQAGSKVVLMAQTPPFSRELVDLGGANLDGLLLAGYFNPQADDAATKRFVAAFKKDFGDLTPTHVAANTYDAAQAVFDGLRHAHTRAELRDFLRQTPRFDGVLGPFALGRRLDARPVWIIELRGGLYRVLERAD
jgi:serine/threonine-protein kinase